MPEACPVGFEVHGPQCLHALEGNVFANAVTRTEPPCAEGFRPYVGGCFAVMPIIGVLDKSVIDAVIKRNMAQIRYCYQRELDKDPAFAGRLTVKFVIAGDGTVTSATTKATTMNNPAVESCINGRFMKFTFPEPKGGGIVIVSYPFVFSPG